MYRDTNCNTYPFPIGETLLTIVCFLLALGLGLYFFVFNDFDTKVMDDLYYLKVNNTENFKVGDSVSITSKPCKKILNNKQVLLDDDSIRNYKDVFICEDVEVSEINEDTNTIGVNITFKDDRNLDRYSNEDLYVFK